MVQVCFFSKFSFLAYPLSEYLPPASEAWTIVSAPISENLGQHSQDSLVPSKISQALGGWQHVLSKFRRPSSKVNAQDPAVEDQNFADCTCTCLFCIHIQLSSNTFLSQTTTQSRKAILKRTGHHSSCSFLSRSPSFITRSEVSASMLLSDRGPLSLQSIPAVLFLRLPSLV